MSLGDTKEEILDSLVVGEIYVFKHWDGRKTYTEFLEYKDKTKKGSPRFYWMKVDSETIFEHQLQTTYKLKPTARQTHPVLISAARWLKSEENWVVYSNTMSKVRYCFDGKYDPNKGYYDDHYSD
jgi:hypothetical protein